MVRPRLTQIDTWFDPDAPYFLGPDDVCYYYGDYTPGGGYLSSATNNLVSNFKKGLEKRGKPEWPYKEGAIRQAANYFAAALNHDWLKEATLVPIPPSRAKSDPLYDDRLVRMLGYIQQRVGFDLEIRELLYQTATTRSSSQSSTRLTVDELRRLSD